MAEEGIGPFDEKLIARTRPPGWHNPRPQGRYNLVVLGGGTAGLVCAAAAAGLGARVALVEKHRLGGDCVNFGCVPSKALLRCGRAAAEVRRAAEFGVRTGGPVEVDFAAVMRRMRRLRAELSPNDSAERFRDLGVDVFLGAGRFTSPRTIEVAGETLHFARAVVATGTRPARPEVPGLDDIGCLTNETIFDLTDLPRRLLVIGAGPVGCELAQAFGRFGSEVHLVNRSDAVLSREEPEAGTLLRQRMQKLGIHLHLGERIVAAGRDAGQAYLVVEGAGGARRLPSDAVLLAVGRLPNVENLGLEQAGVEHDPRTGVKVNDFLQTTNRRVYAAGDVCSPLFRFTHAADAMARVVVRNALLFDRLPVGRGRASRLVIPWCTYTEPEVARLGMTARQAEERGTRVRTFREDFREVDRAVLDGETEGFAMVHVRKGDGRIVGATIVGSQAGELIGEVSSAAARGQGLGAFAQAVRPYPTRGEVLRRLGDAYQRSRLTPRVAALLRMALRWAR